MNLKAEFQTAKNAINEREKYFYTVLRERDSYKKSYEKALILLSKNGIEPPKDRITRKKKKTFTYDSNGNN